MQVQIQSRRIIAIFRPYCRCSLSTTRWIESEYALYVWFYFVSCVFPFPLVWLPFFAFQHAFLSLPLLFLRHLSLRLCLSPRWIYHPPNTTSLRMNLAPPALERGGGSRIHKLSALWWERNGRRTLLAWTTDTSCDWNCTEWGYGT